MLFNKTMLASQSENIIKLYSRTAVFAYIQMTTDYSKFFYSLTKASLYLILSRDFNVNTV